MALEDEGVTPETTDEAPPVETSQEAEPAEAESKDRPPRRRERSQNYRQLREERDRLYELVQKSQQKQADPGPVDAEPKREQFDDYEAFIESRARWVARQEFQTQTKKEREQQQAERQSKEAREIQSRWEDSHEAATDAYEDYEDIYETVGSSIDSEQAWAIKMADEPAEVVYYLGKNPKEFARVKELNGARLVKAIGAIEERIKSQRAQRSRAPDPIAPVRGSKPTPNQLSDSLSTKEWMLRRNKQLGR